MKKYVLLLFVFAVVSQKLTYCQSASEGKKNKKWTVLFDGKTLNGWRKASHDTLPDKAWFAQNGILTFDPSIGHGGDIITTSTFKNFEFSIQFKVSEGGNSGIKYFIFPNSSLGCEYQIIDDERHADASLGKNGNRKAASLYDLIPADPKKKYKPAGEWNTARIIVVDNHVEHWLNGSKVLEYERGSEEFRHAIAESKFKTTKNFSEVLTTPILLQAHGDKVCFQNIRIKEL
jgi:hypothetical protein